MNKTILSPHSVDHIKRLRKTDQWSFVRLEWDKFWTYNDCLLVWKKNSSEALFFVITAAREKIAVQKWDMFVYWDTKETLVVNNPTDISYFSPEG